MVPVGEPAPWPGDSVGQHQEGEGKQEAQQNEQEGAYAPDGGQDYIALIKYACGHN